MTCLHFRRSDCDVVVVEVGMGGRFDASNVISSRLSIVTSIGTLSVFVHFEGNNCYIF